MDKKQKLAGKSPIDLFTNMKVGIKISVGFAIILVLLSAVALQSYLGLSGANKAFSQYRSYAIQTNQLGRIQANLLSARLAAKDFIISNTDEAATSVRERIATTAALIEESTALFERESAIETITSAAGHIAAYGEAFNEVTLLALRRNELVDELNTLGPVIEKDLTAIMESAFADDDASASFLAGTDLRNLLLARLYASRFLVDNTAASADRANAELADFIADAQKMRAQLRNPTRRELAQEVIELGGRYQEAFATTITTINARNAIITGTLDRLGPQMADELEQLKLENKALQDELGPRATQNINNAVLTTEIVSIVAIIIGALLAFFIGRAISGPITRLTQTMQKLAAGELDTEVEGVEKKDELGEMARAVEVFKENGLARLKLESQSETEQRQQAEKQLRVEDLINNFRETVSAALEVVSSNTTEMSATANTLTTLANGTSGQANEASSASQSASENVQAVAAAAEELAASIEEISRQVSKTNTIVNEANTATIHTNEKVANLAKAAQKIGDVISLIQDIAEQTNLLALNTSIEAARAGEAGKGFAVVASEVKSLANQTATATEEISAQIADIQTSTGDAVSAIEQIAKTMAEVNSYTASIASAVEEQGAATAEISQSVSQAATGTQSVVGSLGVVTNSVGETNESAAQVLAASEDVSQQAHKLKSTVDKFLSDVAAA